MSEENQRLVDVLEFPENVRLNSAMYIGDRETSSHILREIIDNSVDEALDPNSTCDEIHIYQGEEDEMNTRWFAVTDNGRGIPILESPKRPGETMTKVSVSTLSAGSNFSDRKGERTSIGCFTADTEVLVSFADSDDWFPIKFIDLVELSKKEKLKTKVWNGANYVDASIAGVMETNQVNDLIELELESGLKVKCTPTHKFYLKDGSVKHADELTENDELLEVQRFDVPLQQVLESKFNIQGGVIYRIHNDVDNKSYIGSSVFSLENRFVSEDWCGQSHYTRIMEHDSRPVYGWINSIGVEHFKVEILEYGRAKSELPELEKTYIEKFNSCKNGYNATPDGESLSGYDCNEPMCIVHNDDRFTYIYKKNLQKWLDKGYKEGYGNFQPMKRDEVKAKAVQTRKENNSSFWNRETQRELAYRGSMKGVEAHRTAGTGVFAGGKEQAARSWLGNSNFVVDVAIILDFLKLKKNRENWNFVARTVSPGKYVGYETALNSFTEEMNNPYSFDVNNKRHKALIKYIKTVKSGGDVWDEEAWNKTRKPREQFYKDATDNIWFLFDGVFNNLEVA